MPNAAALHALGEIYGHKMDDFYLDDPPPPDLSTRDAIQWSRLPGVKIPEEIANDVQRKIDEANALIRDAKGQGKVKTKKKPR